MKLKSLTLVGFKSFKDRTKLTFEEGITAIVGPNGCGKSNVVDALFWVLGDQSPKHLRTQHMAEVIFSGTDQHKASGYCEVTLQLTREGATIPKEYDDPSLDHVSVTRRLYVDGESEYLINQQRCRLKDVVSLFLDSGLVGSSYGIIQQGVISQMIQSKAQDRSLLIQEVAGLTKYQVKQDEAQRKMQLTKTHCTRIQDLISELEKQKESLQKQAEAAKQYKELDTQVRDLHQRSRSLQAYVLETEVTQKGAELTQIEDQCATRLTTLNDFQATSEKNNEALRVKDNELKARRSKLEELSRNLESVRLETNNLFHNQEKLRLLLQQSEQDDQRIQRQAADTIRRRDQDQAQLQKLSSELEGFVTENASLVQRHAKGREKESELDKELAQVRQEAEQHESQKSTSSLQQQRALTQLESAFETYTKNLEAAKNLQGKLRAIQKEHLELTQALKDQEAVCESYQQQHQDVESEIQKIQSDLQHTQSKKREAEHQIEGHTLKADQIRAWIRTQSSPQDDFQVPPNVLPMVDAVEIPQAHHEVATRFLHFYQNVWTCKDRASVLSLAQLLPAERSRGMMVAVAGRGGREGAPQVTESSEVGWLGSYGAVKVWDHLWSDQPGQHTFGVLAKPLYEVTDIGVLLDILDTQNIPLPCHFRSKEGAILFADGMIYFPPTRADTSDMFKNKDHERGLLTNIEKLKVEWGLLDAKLKQCEKLLAELTDQEQELSESASEAENNMSRAQTLLHQKALELDYLGQQARDKRSLLDATFEHIKQARRTYNHQQEALEHWVQALEDLNQRRLGLEQVREKFREETIRLSASYDMYIATKSDRESHVQRLQDEVGRFNEQLEDLESQRQLLALNKKQYQQDLLQTTQRYEGVKQRCEGMEKEYIALRVDVEQSQKAYEGLIDQRESTLGQMRKLEKEMTELEQQRFQLSSAVQVATQTLQELKLEPIYPLPEDLKEIPEDQKKTVLNKLIREYNSVKRDLEALGDVNLLAIHQYEEISDRLEFLTGQRDDLLASLQNLDTTIREIQSSVKQTFLAVFEKVNAAFQRYFPVLFRGGQGYLSLTEESPEDNLPGVEIHAAPPGKKMKHNALLSGGEKALVALGLIISLFEVKPSPFLVMDEVDSPFDEANVESFIDICRRISKMSQVLLITHNKKTMQSSDTLYGVTLREKGISQIVSVRLVQGSAAI